MKILVLSTTPRMPDNRPLWEGLRHLAEVDLRFVPKEEQADLRRLLTPEAIAGYDRIVLDLLFRHVSKQARLLRTVPRLVLCEEDACQEFIATSKWRGRFSAFYRQVPHARVMFSGYRTAQAFAAMGVDACFMPKGFGGDRIYVTGGPRDIELAFIGRLASDAYDQRREFLQRAADECGVQILRTEPGDAYRNMLNRIRIFVSADIGLGEYMAKNFEAMACGCLLLACRQGEGEEEALGLVDGENVVLYRDFAEFENKLAGLRAMPEKIEVIAKRGCLHALERFEYAGQSPRFYDMIGAPLRALPPTESMSSRILGLLLQLFGKNRSGRK